MTIIAALFDHNRARFSDFLLHLADYTADFARIGENRPPEPRWDQVWFPRLDACVAYAIVRDHKPRRIVEVGSGHSTRFMARAIRDGGLATHLISIDPAPRAILDGLAIERIAQPVQDVEFPLLETGDILFIDSSHVQTPGSDVDHLLAHVLPTLPVGVLVHFHDIFLPDPYPTAWDYRHYNEQLAILPLLERNAYELLFAGQYVATTMTDEFNRSAAARLPLLDGAFENSLWLRKR